MSFVRPEVRALLWRWRELLAGAALIALGLWWALGVTGWLLNALGGLLALAGAALALLGLQRARFRDARDGPGVVQVTEGRVAYFGPLTGGAVDIAELTRLSLDRQGQPAHWVLRQPGCDPLHIPVSAKGGEALFDAFSALPGLRTEHMLRELHRAGGGESLIWQRQATRAALH